MGELRTRSQKMAEDAWQVFHNHTNRSNEYDSFARTLPALIHTAGLCQAVAFAQAKGKGTGPASQVLRDVANCMGVFPLGVDALNELIARSRTAPAAEYMRLSRIAIAAAGFIKRYSEAAQSSAQN